MRAVAKKIRLAAVSVVGVLALSPVGRADVFHYNNVLVGDRANGMGGAYSAVADDASGTYYNPAGIAFAQSNDLSGSANAYYNKSLLYKNVLGGQDYTENAGGLFSPFIGILNKLDRFVPGLVGAFSFYTSDTELLNQNDRWPLVLVGGSETKATALDGFHRTVQLKSSTSHAAIAAGYRLSGRMSIGAGLRYTMIDELSQDFQKSTALVLDIATGKITKKSTTYVNTRTSLSAIGVEPNVGAQMALGQSLSIGLSFRKGMMMSQAMEQASDSLSVTREDATEVTADTAPTSSTETPSTEDTKISNPFGSIPGEVRLGAAWFASPKLLVSGDLSYYDPATDGKVSWLRRQSVLNYAAGTEYYVTPSIALRAGAFTNNDARPDVVTGKTNQGAKIDFKGGSLFVAYVQPNTQLSLGAVVQGGTGKSQKLEGATKTEDMSGSITTLSFSATTSL
ncbi:hypothetical protein EBZ80_10810 [bacterium]|nr:hypothetical protein [bacterium]